MAITEIILYMLTGFVFLAFVTMYGVIREQSNRLGALHKQMLTNQLAKMALDASKETGSMVGPAVLQTLPKGEIRKPEPSGTTKEKPKQSGVTLKY